MAVRFGEHPPGAARRVVDRADDAPLFEFRLRGEQQVDHQPDDLPRREVLARLLVGLLRADADEFLEQVPHADVVHAARRQVEAGEGLDDLEQEFLLSHLLDLLSKLEALDHFPHLGREVGQVAVQVRRQPLRVTEQLREVERRPVDHRALRDPAQVRPDSRVRPASDLLITDQHLLLRRGEHAVETPQHGQRQDDLPVLVALVRPPEQVADPPDEVDQLPVRLGTHGAGRAPRNAGGRYRPRGRFQSRGFGWYTGVAHGEAKSAASGAPPGSPESVPSSEDPTPWVSSR